MNRRVVIALGAAMAIGVVAAYPQLRPHVWKWHMQIEEMPLSGAMISYRDVGKGGPVAVIISGVAVPKTAYLDLQTKLADTTRVITYDRPGIGDSTPNTEPRTLAVIDQDLSAFLRALDVPPPYVLIGHSWGGHIIRYFADQHPEEVAGLVFLDQPHEDWFEYIRRTWSAAESEAYFKTWTAANPSYTGTLLEEVLAYEENCAAIRGVGIPPDVPVLMFTSSNYGHFRTSAAGLEEDRRNWASMQASLLPGVKDKKLLVDMELSHWVHQDKPEWVTGEIEAFIAKLRRAPRAADSVSSSSPAPSGGTAASPASSL
jgi:pimeloyl-ACP methyl ester carboxylesterase